MTHWDPSAPMRAAQLLDRDGRTYRLELRSGDPGVPAAAVAPSSAPGRERRSTDHGARCDRHLESYEPVRTLTAEVIAARSADLGVSVSVLRGELERVCAKRRRAQPWAAGGCARSDGRRTAELERDRDPLRARKAQRERKRERRDELVSAPNRPVARGRQEGAGAAAPHRCACADRTSWTGHRSARGRAGMTPCRAEAALPDRPEVFAFLALFCYFGTSCRVSLSIRDTPNETVRPRREPTRWFHAWP
jgi:hypothetical protein